MIGDVATGSLAAIAQRNATNRENPVAITAESTAIGDVGLALLRLRKKAGFD
jgi:hypothetical protein